MRRRAALALLVVLATGACTRSNASTGGGAEIDFCGGYEAYDSLVEPDVSRVDAVVDYASSVLRVIDRIDEEMRVDGEELPEEMQDHLEALEDSMRTLRTDARESIPAAESKLFFSDDARETDAALTKYYDDHCGEQSDDPIGLPSASGEMVTVTPEQLAAAVAIAELTVANDWAAIRADFDETMTEGLSEELLAETWATVVEQVGVYVSRSDPVPGPPLNEVVSVDITLTFERGDIVLRIAFDGDDEIAGFFFLPPGG